MPQLGESVTEGTIGRWLKQPGDEVAKYEALLEVITDKVDTEVPAPIAGTLLEILVPEGETVRVGTVIARLGNADDATTDDRRPTTDAQTTAPSPPSTVHRPPSEAAPPSTVHRPPSNGDASRNSYMSPVVARLVAEHGLDLAQVLGTGQAGRVTKQDVLRFVEARAAQPAAANPPPADAATPHSALSTQHSALTPELPEDAELLPLSPMRRAIAEHMVRSVRTAPHVTTVMEVDLSQIIAHREANKAAFERQGVRLTFTPYFFQATVAGLQRAPVLNGSFTEQGIVLNRRAHIGMAVALDEGLLVPVLRDADEKNLLGLARAVGDLAERARTRRLRPEETQGGTFTITNHGVSGSLFATPIINLPQAAILGIGAIVKRPVVVSHGGTDAIAIKPMCYLSLTFDHRIADGALADGFLAAVKAALEGYELTG